jgi:hypothetical protein
MTTGPDEFTRILSHLEARFGLPPGFLKALYAEDDWSFVVKAHALVEAVVSDLLTSHVGRQSLKPIFERLELSETSTGKLAFVKALGLLRAEELGFVKRFSELRNRLVHNVRNVSFRFDSYVAGLDRNQRKAFQSALTYFTASHKEVPDWRETALRRPKMALWFGTVNLLGRAFVSAAQAEAERESIAAKLRILEEMFEKGQGMPESNP